MSKFIIFANARSGSTSLAKLLDESPDVKLSLETFHPGYSKWNPGERDYSSYIKDSETMNESIDEIISKFTAMKVLAYQFPEDIYFTMLNRKDFKIVLLRRKNLAQMSLSALIAEQTSIYHKSEMDEEKYKNLKPINIEKMREMIEYVKETDETYLSYLKSNRKGEYLHLFYEDLYSDDMEKNREKITEICRFLEISLPPDSAIEKYMKPTNSKQNQNDIYKKVPNWKVIEKTFPGIFN